MTGPSRRAEATAEGTPGPLGLRALGRAQLARLRAAALHLPETGGVVVPGESARSALIEAGVLVERATGVAHIPARLIEEALALAPATPVLGGRLPERDVVLGRSGRLTTGGPAAELLMADGEMRLGGRDDLAAACRLADGLPEVAVVAGPPLAAGSGAAVDEALPDGSRAGRAVLVELEVCLANTTKHILLTTVESPAQGEAVAGMAAAAAGGDGALRRRPPVSLVAPGLPVVSGEVDALLAAARRGLPVGFALGLGDAPVGREVAVARAAASALAAGAVVELVAPGATFIASLPGDAVRPTPSRLAEAPSAWWLALAYNELMSSFGLPSLIPSPAVAERPGWHSSVETTFAALVTTLGSPGLSSGAGLLAGGRAFSPGQLVLDCESHAVCARIARGIEVDEETVALETIAAVGIGGNALAQRHTRRHMGDVWRPRVFDRSSLETWQREGRVGSERKAEELAARILAEHEVPPLEAEKAETLARIVATSGL